MIKKYILHLVVLFFILFIAFVFDFNSISLDGEIDRQAYLTDYIIKNNQVKYYKIVTQLFDEAQSCFNEICRASISEDIHRNLIDMKQSQFYEGIYFIRIIDNKIQKLFINGQFKEDQIVSKGEKKVKNFIINNSNAMYLKGMRVDNLFSNMRYLKDEYSEAEIIIPIRTYDNLKIVGALVKTYGD